MTEELEQLLKNLKLRRILNIYDEQLRAAETGQPATTGAHSGRATGKTEEREALKL